MMLKLVLLVLCTLHLTVTLPTNLMRRERALRHTLEDMEDADDTSSMGSNIRGTRAASSGDGDYFKSDEREGNGEIGYSRKKAGGGKKGYQHFDSYHKKAGDNYEFEKQDSYGLDDKGQDGAYSHRHDTTVKKEQEREHEPEELEDFDDELEERQKSKSKEEIKHESLREGAEDGNGGVEAFGHDPKDYILPEKYTYGKEADSYDF